MTAERQCSQCGAKHPSGVLQGLCCECVIRVTLGPLLGDDPDHPDEPLPSPQASPPGSHFRIFGDYELLEEIAHGGMGVVWRARQISLNRVVAVKMIRAGLLASDAEVQRFHSEAEAVASLDHPNIVPVYDVGEHGGQHYFSMKLIEGGSLAKFVTDGRWSQPPGVLHAGPAAAALVAKIARAIHYAHQHGFIHRDVKPGNILVDPMGEPHLTDFGLARQVEGSLNPTLAGTVLGTPSYMSPEQASGGSQRLTTATDIYSLGAILYELLGGRPPFVAETPLETLRQVVQDEPVPPSQVRSKIPNTRSEKDPEADSQSAADAIAGSVGLGWRSSFGFRPSDLEVICLKCLEKDPQRRYSSAAELADDLDRWRRDEPILARRSTLRQRVLKWVRRRPIRAAGTAALLLVLMAGVSGVWWEWRRAERKGEESRQRLVRMHIANGTHCVAEGDLSSALPWFVEALRLEGTDPSRNLDHRTRIATVQRQSPRPVQLWFHDGAVNHAEFSRDGRRVITTGADKTAQIWEVATGQASTPPLQHEAGVTYAVFSRDGARAITACDDGTVRVWDARTGRPLTPPLAQRRGASLAGIAVSVDGKRLVAADSSSTARIWDALTGQPIGVPMKHDGGISCVHFSPDGERVLTAGSRGVARLWDAATGQPTGPTLELGQEIYCAAFDPTGARVITAGMDGLAQVWDAVTGTPVGLALRHSKRVTHAEFDSSGARVVTASLDGTARVWDALTGQATTLPLQHHASVFHAAFSPDGRRVVTSSHAHVAGIWDLADGTLLFPPLWHGNVVRHAVFSPDGRQVLTASADGAARLWNLNPASSTISVMKGESRWDSAVFLSDRRCVATVNKDHDVRVWDLATGQPLSTALPHGRSVPGSAISRHGHRLATGCDDGGVRVWDIDRGELVAEFHSRKAIHSVAWSQDGRRVVAASRDNAAYLLALDHDVMVPTALKHDGPVNYASFSRDGQRVATVSNDRTARVWDARTGQPITPSLPHAEAVKRLAFSPDGRRIATASRDGTARIWDTTTGRELTPPLRHGNWVNDVSFSPDGKGIMTTSDDGTARVWDASTGAARSAPLRAPGGLWGPQFSRDGRRVLAYDERAAQVWDAQTGLPLTPPLTPHGRIGDASFSADETQVILSSLDGRVVAWEITPMDWALEDLEAAAQLLTSRRIDATDALVPLDQAPADRETNRRGSFPIDLRRAWERLRARHPGEFSPP